MVRCMCVCVGGGVVHSYACWSHHWHILISDSVDPFVHGLHFFESLFVVDGVDQQETITLSHILLGRQRY